MSYQEFKGLLVVGQDGHVDLSNQTNFLTSEDGAELVSYGHLSEANARRLAACWNACRGWSTGLLSHPEHPGFMERMWQEAWNQARLMEEILKVRKEKQAAFGLLAELIKLEHDGNIATAWACDATKTDDAGDLIKKIRSLLEAQNASE